MSSVPYLQNLMSRYQVKNLVALDPVSFKKEIDGFIHLQDHEMEGFQDPEKQRDLSIKFHWGHDHDFGTFQTPGRMGMRHIEMLARFIDQFQAIPKSLDGLRVLDIGCWTGGTSMLLCAMGAHVVAIEEVKKYSDCLDYLKQCFNIKRLEPKNISLYDCTTPEFQDAFDIILFPGVIYHVTDPVAALRITFNCLKDGGATLLETAAIDSDKRILSYLGPSVFGEGGTREGLDRSGWSWFFPSPGTLSQMMADVGYSDIRMSQVADSRLFAVGQRKVHVDMMRGGLSLRGIR